MPTTTGPTIAAPVDPKAYRNYFQKLAEEVIVLAWKARARVRFWNYWGSGTWTAFLPFASLTRDGSPVPSFRYRLAFGFLFWGIDIGFVPPKKLSMSPDWMPEKFMETYSPDEANERP